MRHHVGMRRIRHLMWGIAAALAFGLGACRVASPPAAFTPTMHASATPALGITSGPVAVAVDKPHYAPDETIVASIHNGLSMPIFARDERSGCTLVNLERWVSTSWQIQAPCVNMQPAPHVVRLAPDAVLAQQLAPILSDASNGPWPKGTYRIAFAYVTGANQPLGQSTVIYSASFTIG